MDERVATLAVALVCLFAVGSAAGSLESAVDSSPSDAIDLDYTSLPLDRGQASDIKRQYNKLTGDSNEQSEPSSQSSQSGSEPQQQQEDGDGDSTTSSSATNQLKTGTSGEQDLLASLLDALFALLAKLVTVVAAAILLGGVAVVYRYREQIAARLAPYLDRFGADQADAVSADEFVPPATPENEVTEAWYEMVQHAKLDDERPLTPRERASIARQDGADANSVWSMTELFEEVQYGGAPVTDDRRQRAHEYLDRYRRVNGGNES